MKAFITISFFTLLFSAKVLSQYSVNTTLNTYEELTNSISLNGSNVWNEGTAYPVYFNFDFSVYGQTYTAFNVVAGGGITFPGLGYRQLFIYHTPFGGYMLKDRGTSATESTISYKIDGNVGSRILKIQWKNAGFIQWFNSSSPSHFVNFQIWFYEADSHIEVRFGPSSTTAGTYGYPEDTNDSNPGPSVKFIFDSCANTLGLIGNGNLPSYQFFSTCSPNYSFIDGTPSSGVTYNFYPTLTSGTTELSSARFVIYPNPTSDILHVRGITDTFLINEIILTDVNGRICMLHENCSAKGDGVMSISLGGLKAGLYMVRLISESGLIYTERIVLQ